MERADSNQGSLLRKDKEHAGNRTQPLFNSLRAELANKMYCEAEAKQRTKKQKELRNERKEVIAISKKKEQRRKKYSRSNSKATCLKSARHNARTHAATTIYHKQKHTCVAGKQANKVRKRRSTNITTALIIKYENINTRSHHNINLQPQTIRKIRCQ